MYSYSDTVAALRWFGWKQAKAEELAKADAGKYAGLVREYKRHAEEV